MRLLVCGDRRWSDVDAVRAELSFMHGERPLTCVIHGDCTGADRMAGDWARQNGVEEIACPADWKNLRFRAGPIRNAGMLAQHKPDAALAFHDDLLRSAGTGDMVQRALRAGLQVIHWSHKRGAVRLPMMARLVAVVLALLLAACSSPSEPEPEFPPVFATTNPCMWYDLAGSPYQNSYVNGRVTIRRTGCPPFSAASIRGWRIAKGADGVWRGVQVSPTDTRTQTVTFALTMDETRALFCAPGYPCGLVLDYARFGYFAGAAYGVFEAGKNEVRSGDSFRITDGTGR